GRPSRRRRAGRSGRPGRRRPPACPGDPRSAGAGSMTTGDGVERPPQGAIGTRGGDGGVRRLWAQGAVGTRPGGQTAGLTAHTPWNGAEERAVTGFSPVHRAWVVSPAL